MTLGCRSTSRFLREHTENNWRKDGAGHTSRTCPVCGSALLCNTFLASMWLRSKVTPEGKPGSFVLGSAPVGSWMSTLPTLMWCHLLCLCLFDLIVMNPVLSARCSVPQVLAVLPDPKWALLSCFNFQRTGANVL